MKVFIDKPGIDSILKQGNIIEFAFDGKVNDLHPKSLFSFPIPEGMTYENEPIKFEIEI